MAALLGLGPPPPPAPPLPPEKSIVSSLPMIVVDDGVNLPPPPPPSDLVDIINDPTTRSECPYAYHKMRNEKKREKKNSTLMEVIKGKS